MIKAIALLSGGLDSILATKMILQQGIDVEAVNFLTVFCNCTARGKSCLASKSAADQLGVRLKVFEVSKDYFEIIKKPKHGYGRNLNPCLDCRIFMFKKAKEYMTESGAAFVVTGEVLGERPMSQRKEAMRIIEKESGLAGLIVRPLSAKLFAISIPEKEKWVDREKFMNIEGRSRKPQIELATTFGINDYPCPAGGCLLTDKDFSGRMRDLMRYSPDFGVDDVNLIKTGRLFRISPSAKVVVGRDEAENERLLNLAKESDLRFWPVSTRGPVGIGRGNFCEEGLLTASGIISRYSDRTRDDNVKVACALSQKGETRHFTASPLSEIILKTLRVQFLKKD